MTTMYAVDVYHPSCALAVASPGGVWRMPRSTLSKSLRGWRGFVRARLQGSLHAVSHVEYDTSEPAARMGRDCIDRRTLVIGPAFVLAYLARLPGGESGDIFKDMDKLFVYREDADEAVNDLTSSGRASIEC